MTEVEALAAELEISDRSVRRLMALGLIRKSTLGRRRLGVHASEREYLLARWPDLAGIRRDLRTRQRVRLAVLFGAAASDAGAWDDWPLQIYVEGLGEAPGDRFAIEQRLALAAGRPVRVHVASRWPGQRAPLWLHGVLTEGRVLADRGGNWADARRLRGSLARRNQLSRSAARFTLPLGVLGSSEAKSTIRGYL